ncbi:lysozyme inhibitor LprI family protein [Tabrizicola sp.]|jgi:uncharacterized protein YecT (DUF1311 family)|uniref:lysozyme inhibitor LprI family protein n=1 Tax=Tabrizicola sp. TaxID=2005166 RepID=UPI000BDB2C45|nr:lysozyme inhibitor LprI family protein [Tabrizicola sp.]MBY0352128.1 lysozyme inhibitor LprI family protein [Tabrizicola sp.]MDK2775310.1 lysozyme inhibitor LprI family protein [Tabrizicola sp.]OYX18393.1 MAG: hypothetical protein B7Z04_12320 [Rhodobacterales bacterium 32-66-9]
MTRLLLTFCFCLGTVASAQDADCADAATQLDLNRCAAAAWEAADARLNDAYRVAIALVKDWDSRLADDERGAADRLREAQRAWITFRDKGCEAEGYAMKGGSAEPMVVLGCMRAVTLDRARQLEDMVAAYGN